VEEPPEATPPCDAQLPVGNGSSGGAVKRRAQKPRKRRSLGETSKEHPAPRRRVVDLPRAQQALAELTRILTENPEVRDRTARMLAGELPCPDLEEKSPCRRNRKRRASPTNR
jgi:hypothetical protein